METTLRAIQAHPALELQMIATGMHLSRAHGYSMAEIQRAGWVIDATIPWDSRAKTPARVAAAMGHAIEKMSGALERIKTDVVLVVGDRVEAFAAAAAAHVSQRLVAHVHGGDRAQGQVDDALRHAISKLAHVHLAATRDSADRLIRMGENRKSVHVVGAPGVDQITTIAAPWSSMRDHLEKLQQRRYAMVVYHPTQSNEAKEYKTAQSIAAALKQAGFDRAIFIHPNNDPGWRGIARCWGEVCDDVNWHFLADAPRAIYLGLLGNAACLVGNSSSGVLEAASFRTWVVNVGPRQTGRLHSANQIDVDIARSSILAGLRKTRQGDKPRRYTGGNVYGKSGAGVRIARILADLPPRETLLRKLISY